MQTKQVPASIVAAVFLLLFSHLTLAASVSGSNTGNVNIPDAAGYVSSTITISGAPAAATVTGIDVNFRCVHAYSGDLVVDLNADSTGSLGNRNLWNREGGSADNPTRTTTGITTFNGLPVNRTWYLYAKDFVAGDSGYIDEWTITVYYSLPNTTPTSGLANQYRTDTGAAIPLGGSIPSGVNLNFKATVNDADSDTVKLEVELRQLPATFTGVATLSSSFVSSGSQAVTATAGGLAEGNWGWRYRVVDSRGAAGNWSSVGNPDFIVTGNTTPTSGLANQHRTDTGAAIPLTSAIPSGVNVNFKATLNDADGDTVKLEVELRQLPATFTGVATHSSGLVNSGSQATTSTASGLAAGNWGWRYRVVDSRGAAGNWSSIGNPDFIVSANTTPTSGLANQYRTDTGAAIPLGSTIQTGVNIIFKATLNDADGDAVKFEVELRQLPATFTGVATHSSSFVSSGSQAVTATATGLAAGNWGWRYRVLDSRGAAGNWSSVGNPDFIVTGDTTPTSGLANQYRTDTGAAIPLGSTIQTGVNIIFKATLNDADGDAVKLEVELRQLPATFTGVATHSSSFVSSGSQATTATATGLAAGNWGWRYRVLDSRGAAGNWSSVGNPDFIVTGNTTPTSGLANQHRTDTGAAIPLTSTIPSGVNVNFKATLSDADGDTIKLEVELRQLPATFTGVATHSSGFVNSGSQATTATASGLVAGNWGWRYRVVDDRGAAGNWSSVGNPDFVVQGTVTQPVLSVSPSDPPVQSASAGSVNLAVSNSGGGTMGYSASVTSSSSWLSIAPGGSGGNSGTIGISYLANPGAQRNGTIQVTASGASGSPITITIIQAGASGGNVMLPGSIPYIRQIGTSDMHPNFNSANACGPSSAVMILSYYNRLPAHPMIGKSGQNNDYSWYVAPVDKDGVPSGTAYSFAGFTFNIATRDNNPGTYNYGAHGYICQDNQDDPQTTNLRALEYLWKHGLWASLDYLPTVEKVRAEIGAGRPILLSTRYAFNGHHIMVVRGYEPSVLSPGSGTEASHLASRLIAADPWVRTSTENRSAISYTWEELHYTNDQKYMIRAITPITAGDRIQAVATDPFNVREQPSLSANPVGTQRGARQLGTVVLDASKNSAFWNADGWTWVKVLWDSDQVVGWSAIGSSPNLWMERIAGSQPVVATPTISPAGGSFYNSVQVTLACSTTGATIRYTTDGSAPTSSSPIYSLPFTLTSSATVKSKAFASGYSESTIVSASLTVTPTPTVATPTIMPAGGGFSGSAQVTLTCSTAGATIRYSTDGSTPTTGSPAYIAPFTLTSSATVKARAFASGYNDSSVASANFTVTPVQTVATPTITPASGSFIGSIHVTLACTTSGAVIRYTVNGNDTTDNSPVYAGPFTLTSSGTVKAKAFVSGFNDSAIATASFTLTPPTVATPTISPAGGSFNTSAQVTLTCATGGATVRYTTDGSNPTSGSPAYTSPFTLTSSATVKAKAFASGYTDSAVASASFTIAPTSTVATPTVTPSSGTYNGVVQVGITCATAGATIRYTTDGNDPTGASPLYAAPFTLNASAVVKAKGYAGGYTDSTIASASFTVIPLAITGIGGGAVHPPNGGIFQLEVHSSQAQVTIQISDDAVNWVDVGTLGMVDGKAYFVDGSAGANIKRFYRLKP